MAKDNTSKRGFASMDAAQRSEIASMGGKASSNAQKSAAGKKGAAAQPVEAKRKGGENSHRT